MPDPSQPSEPAATGQDTSTGTEATRPLVSVIVPNYRHEKYLPARLDSILNQTFQDFEIILLDDCSPDGSVAVLERYAEVFSQRLGADRVQTCFNTENSGSPFKQWNRGVAMARGPYIWIAESDDEAEPELLATLAPLLETHRELGMAFGETVLMNTHGRHGQHYAMHLERFAPGRFTQDHLDPDGSIYGPLMAISNVVPNASGVVFRRSAFEAIGGGPEDFKVCGDWWVWFQMIARFGTAYSCKKLNFFRSHESTARHSEHRKTRYLLECLRIVNGIHAQHRLDPSQLAASAHQMRRRWAEQLARGQTRFDEASIAEVVSAGEAVYGSGWAGPLPEQSCAGGTRGAGTPATGRYAIRPGELPFDPDGVERFCRMMFDPETAGYRSVPNGPVTLYGTNYLLLTQAYLGVQPDRLEDSLAYIHRHQDPETGLFVGPELQGYEPPEDSVFDREHLCLHLTCAALPALLHFGQKPQHPCRRAHDFCDVDYLDDWLNRRDWRNAWLEGNNLLYIGQLLVYLRDQEANPHAQAALDHWFAWLDQQADPMTGLWGTDGACSPFVAMCGGYHQLLVYYHEQHANPSPNRLINTTLGLQKRDGGFNPHGGGGACEDVDAVDILVNMTKRHGHRRPEVYAALRRVVRHLVKLQNPDGGFPYHAKFEHNHMGTPGTFAPWGASTAFATWFRVHTLALSQQVLQDEPLLGPRAMSFTQHLSMGWHDSATPPPPAPAVWAQALGEARFRSKWVPRDGLKWLYGHLGPLRPLARSVGSRLLQRGRG